MVYETSLLDPMWWVNSLLGSITLLIVLVEIWLLSFIRKIPNIKFFAILLFGLNIFMLIYAVFAGEGLTISSGLLVLLLAVFGIIAFGGFNES